MESNNYIITIGRQLGSGGSSLGKRLAEHFGFRYIDKEILVKAAEKMHLSEDALKDVDEKSTSIWAMLAQTAAYEVPYIAEEWYVPTSNQLFKMQTQIMEDAVAEGPCVIIGRCASHLFRDCEKHTSIFLQASDEARMERLKRRQGEHKTRRELEKLMEKMDKERAKYYNLYTGKKWLDLREYDFVLDTTAFTDDQVEEILVNYMETRFPELKK